MITMRKGFRVARCLCMACVVIGCVGIVPAATFRVGYSGALTCEEREFELSFRVLHPGWTPIVPSAWQGETGSGNGCPTVGPTRFELKRASDFRRIGHGSTIITGGVDRINVSTDVIFDEDLRGNGAGWDVKFPTRLFAGGQWRVDAVGESGMFPCEYGKMHIFRGACSSVELISNDGRRIRFEFENLTPILLQDNRRWGDSFTLRINDGPYIVSKGDARHYSFSFSTPGEKMTLDSSGLEVITPGPNWIPVEFKKDIAAGSALDLSLHGLQDGPAGKYGWLKNVNGNFEFEGLPGVRQRFYGVNLCQSANIPTHEMADILVRRFLRLGYNTVRIHHHENDLLDRNVANNMDFDPERMDRFDYFVSRMISAGIYLTTDLYVSRAVRWKDIGLPERGDGRCSSSQFKHLIMFWDPAFENWKRFAKMFLEHRNPYTGRRYVDEPALSLLCLVNEGILQVGWSESKADPIIDSAYSTWIENKHAQDPSFCPDAPLHAKDVEVNCNVMASFMADSERRSIGRMKSFIRSIGSRALITNANCQPHPLVMQDVRAELLDYVDDHPYVYHPQFVERAWSLPSRITNENPVGKALDFISSAYMALPDKPMCSTEWAFCGPGRYRGVGGVMMGCLGALQDWDGLWRFAYSHADSGCSDDCNNPPGYFDLALDPLAQVSDMAGVCIFLRRDLESLEKRSTFRLTHDVLKCKHNCHERSVDPGWMKYCWNHGVSTSGFSSEVPDGVVEYPITSKTYDESTPPFEVSPGGSVSMDSSKGTFVVRTHRTVGGFAPPGNTIDCGPLIARIEHAPATVWAMSMDVKPTSIAKANRIVVVHVTDVQANGNVYADDTRRLWLKKGEGKRPLSLAAAGSAEVRLRLEGATDYEVWALDTSGSRVGKISKRVSNGELVFTAEIKHPVARFQYELVRAEKVENCGASDKGDKWLGRQ